MTFLSQGDKLYNAYEKDIAIVNIFFGESTVFGELAIRSKNQHLAILLLTPDIPCLEGREGLPVVSYLFCRI